MTIRATDSGIRPFRCHGDQQADDPPTNSVGRLAVGSVSNLINSIRYQLGQGHLTTP